MRQLVLLIVGLLLSAHAFGQEIRPVEEFLFNIEDYPYVIGEVSFVDSISDCFGVENRKGAKEWTPLYFRDTLQKSLAELLYKSIHSEPGSDTIHIQFNRFFISQNASIKDPRRCTFELQLDIARKSDEGAWEIFSFYASETCHIKMTHGIIHNELITNTLKSVFLAFLKVDSPGNVERLLTKCTMDDFRNTSNIHLQGLQPKTTPQHKNGIYWTYADYLNGRLDTSYEVLIKKKVDSTFSKIKVIDFIQPKDYWAYHIDGDVYYNFYGDGLKLESDGEKLFTRIYLGSDNENIGDALLIASAYVFGGIIGSTIAMQGIEKADEWRNNNEELEIDRYTGSLVPSESDKRDGLKNSIVLYHTRFSQVDSIEVRLENAQVYIPQENYALIELPVSRNGSYLILNDGMSQDTLRFKNIDRTADRFLIKSRKGQVSAQFLSTRDFDSLPKNEVRVIYTEE